MVSIGNEPLVELGSSKIMRIWGWRETREGRNKSSRLRNENPVAQSEGQTKDVMRYEMLVMVETPPPQNRPLQSCFEEKKAVSCETCATNNYNNGFGEDNAVTTVTL